MTQTPMLTQMPTTGRGSVAGEVAEDLPIRLKPATVKADVVFKWFQVWCSTVVLVLLVAVCVFLVQQSLPAIRKFGFHFITDPVWAPDAGHAGVGSQLLGTIAIALVAVVIATPLSLGAALMINEYAPGRVRAVLTTAIDMLATVPSIVYGLWGVFFLSQWQIGPARWITHYCGFIFFARIPPDAFENWGDSIFATGLVCALTIVPIITSVSREVMSQAPREACEAALGLGGTRWGMITDVILPFAKEGIVGAILLGLGRGLGETMIPVFILSSELKVTPAIFGPNGLGSIAKQIAEEFVSASPIYKSALIEAALVLFASTLLVNAFARVVVGRTGNGKASAGKLKSKTKPSAAWKMAGSDR